MVKPLGEKPLFALLGSNSPAADKTASIAGAKGKPGPAASAAAPAHYEGHRERLRQRFREGGPEALPDYELLELVLFRAIPRRDVKPLAKQIVSRFGSFAEAVAAAPERLLEIKGVSEAVVTELKLMHACAVRVAHGEVKERPALASWASVLAYLRTTMAFEPREQVRILFFDKRNHLIADELQTKGTIDQTPIYIREVIKRALELSATAIILAHNHPSGDPKPSKADIDMTKEVSKLAARLGILVHDHVIIGREGSVSLRHEGFFEPDTPTLAG